MLRRFGLLILGLVLAAAVLVGLGTRATGLPPLGLLLDPADGLYRTARQAAYPEQEQLALSGLSAPVTVVRGPRGVPHIFAENHADASAALGYVTAQDRLFQLDFVPRVASGRLAEAFGASSVPADRFLRATGMDWGAKKNLRRIREEEGEELELMRAFSRGVNAYLDGLAPEDLPLEFRLLGYRPDRWTPLQSLRVLQYMTYELTYRTDAAEYAILRERLGPRAYRRLYPRFSSGLFSPMVPPRAQGNEDGGTRATNASGTASAREQTREQAQAVLAAHDAFRKSMRGTPMQGFIPGNGSNNWAVSGARSASGRPILANDMHLSLSLPAVFYEAHVVTPRVDAYGGAIPGTPLLVAAYTDRTAWGFTNTATDQIDHLVLDLTEDGQRYRFEGEERPLRTVVDTIHVNGGAAVRDTLYYSHHGPVLMGEEGAAEEHGGAVALRWVAHGPSRTMKALYGMARARDAAELREALRDWDTPMQSIIYADSSEIGIVAAGHLPVRASGTGAGLLDGTTGGHEWTGRVPFDALPQARQPRRGYLFSNNQQPTDSTYAYYLNHNWRAGYRSMRIDSLLSGKPRHTAADLRRYQADVRSMQHAAFGPLLGTLAAADLSPRADRLRRRLLAFDGNMTTEARLPVSFDAFWDALRPMAWDEAAFAGVRKPADAILYQLLTEAPQSRWLDVAATPDRREDATGLLYAALEAAADTLHARYDDRPRPRWGERHKVQFRHLTQNDALRPLWRGPVSYPGYQATLSPARGDTARHSAAWRMVVDFSESPPVGRGIYPGGQSGNPFSTLYDQHLPSYISFEDYRFRKPRRPGAIPAERVLARLELTPADS